MNGFELAPTRRLIARPRLAPASWILIGSVAAGGLNYMYTLGMTALMAPPDYSIFAGGQAIMLITGTVANTSVPWLLAREISIARERSQVRTVVWFAVMLNFAVGVGAGALTVGLAAGFADPRPPPGSAPQRSASSSPRRAWVGRWAANASACWPD